MVMESVRSHAKGRVELVDGVKVWSDAQTWILIRPSGTEPVVRIFAESDDRGKLDALFEEYHVILREAAGPT
jgi:phosphomannomutase/phosphoglucomutase